MPTLISSLEIDNFSSDVSTTSTCSKKKNIYITRIRRFESELLACFDLRIAARFIYIFDFSPPPNLPSRSGYIESNISPSVFGGYVPALSPILSCRQLQTRRPITVSDEGAAGTWEPLFFEITCEYLDSVRSKIAPTARLIASAAFVPQALCRKKRVLYIFGLIFRIDLEDHFLNLLSF